LKVENKRKKKLKKYENLMKKFKYTESLEEALETRNTVIILSVVEELVYRNGLDVALANLSYAALIILL
jgi:U3 small nucleolar RNA-associated protein 15